MHKEAIQHRGIITAIDKGKVTVEIQVESACSSCEAHGTCMTKDSKSREIIINSNKSNFTIGQFVTLFGEQRSGLKAVLLAYFIPFLLVLATLILSLQVSNNNEGLSGLISLAILVPYYGIIWLMRHKMSKSFQFKINE